MRFFIVIALSLISFGPVLAEEQQKKPLNPLSEAGRRFEAIGDSAEPNKKPLYPFRNELVTAPDIYKRWERGYNEAASKRRPIFDPETDALRKAFESPQPVHPILRMSDPFDRGDVISTIKEQHLRDAGLPALYVLPQNLRARETSTSEARDAPLYRWTAANALVAMGKLAPQEAILKRLEGQVDRDPDLRLMAFVLYELDGPRVGLVRLEEAIDKTHADPRTGWVIGRKNKLANLTLLKEWFTTPGFFQDRSNFPKFVYPDEEVMVRARAEAPEIYKKVYAELNERRRALGLETWPAPDKPKP